jgi:hypothetical protein
MVKKAAKPAGIWNKRSPKKVKAENEEFFDTAEDARAAKVDLPKTFLRASSTRLEREKFKKKKEYDNSDEGIARKEMRDLQ